MSKHADKIVEAIEAVKAVAIAVEADQVELKENEKTAKAYSEVMNELRDCLIDLVYAEKVARIADM